ncbi:hypothetical protein AMECASPLE_027540 [Ameca splendens]|uniref:Uncharacterized protein n=1 Tax=Ameca splendens TaxID=208324 RepID=A0ABV0Y570_9TELE
MQDEKRDPFQRNLLLPDSVRYRRLHILSTFSSQQDKTITLKPVPYFPTGRPEGVFVKFTSWLCVGMDHMMKVEEQCRCGKIKTQSRLSLF